MPPQRWDRGERPGFDANLTGGPNGVKTRRVHPRVVGSHGAALMFSRSVLPFHRDYPDAGSAIEAGIRWNRHLGIYAYRAASLRRFTAMQPTPLECAERLEQLRIIETGGKILMEQACLPIPAGVDTPEDLQRLREIIKS